MLLLGAAQRLLCIASYFERPSQRQVALDAAKRNGSSSFTVSAFTERSLKSKTYFER